MLSAEGLATATISNVLGISSGIYTITVTDATGTKVSTSIELFVLAGLSPLAQVIVAKYCSLLVA